MSNAGSCADPRLNYTGQTLSGIGADYLDMPDGAKSFFSTSRAGAPAGDGAQLYSRGSGHVSVPIGGPWPGDYYLAADDATGNRLDQIVAFYIN